MPYQRFSGTLQKAWTCGQILKVLCFVRVLVRTQYFAEQMHRCRHTLLYLCMAPATKCIAIKVRKGRGLSTFKGIYKRAWLANRDRDTTQRCKKVHYYYFPRKWQEKTRKRDNLETVMTAEREGVK